MESEDVAAAYRDADNLPLAAVDGLPALDTVQGVEVYNHNNAMAGSPDRARGAYMLDGLLEKGYRVLVNAGDDAHFGHPKNLNFR